MQKNEVLKFILELSPFLIPLGSIALGFALEANGDHSATPSALKIGGVLALLIAVGLSNTG